MTAYKTITRCRVCSGPLVEVLSLGKQALTGVFPAKKTDKVTAGPVDLVRCDASREGACGLVQLAQSYDPSEMYGKSYGYHSSLNKSMVDHLHAKVRGIRGQIELGAQDLVLDIGSNDATLLKAYPKGSARLVGIDPTGRQFARFYPPHIELIPEFFSAAAVSKRCGGAKAKVITSIAMFYDLQSPLDFIAQVRDTLADDGLWVFEQSYLPTMLALNAYDTICHEHLEYYGLSQIQWMLERSGMKIVDVELNDVNGGSVSVTAAKASSPRPQAPALAGLLEKEKPLRDPATFAGFRARVLEHRGALREFLLGRKREGKKVLGYGASTKGNVLLQFCGVTEGELPAIGEVNEEKFGHFTPGTLIPIRPEAEVRAAKPDIFLVLPWHFRDFILKKEEAYRRAGGKLCFPLPRLEVV